MFSYPALLWFLPLLGVVVLIHLINMFRHRRVEWAAMEFLLAGYRKSRTRILLQQLLLMLLRTSVVFFAILMLAQPKFEGPLAEWLAGRFGGKATHHLVLLDDSYSMNDRNAAQGGTSLFEGAIDVVARIVDHTARRRSSDRLTLLRSSRIASTDGGGEPDLAEVPLDENGIEIVRDLLRTLRPSQGAEAPERLLSTAQTICRRSTTRLKPIVYFLSDFRRRDWENSAPILKSLEELHQSGAKIRMIRASDGERSNLGIEKLMPVDGIHAAEIDLLLDLVVANRGNEDADNIPVSIQVDGLAQPTLTIPKIRAGEKTEPPVRFPVRLAGGGSHRVEVRLPADAISDDNRRFLVLDVPAALEVLLISPEKRNVASTSDGSTQYLRVALSPGGTKSGIQTRVESPSFLPGRPLDSFSAVFLLDVSDLDPAAVQSLEDYVAGGGGLALFFGPESVADGRLDLIRDMLYKNGEGLLPCDPLSEALLEPDFLSRSPDLNILGRHPIFRLFGEGESPLLSKVGIEHYVAVTPMQDTSGVLATLRGGAPLVVEKNFGRGRVVTFLTSASPVWNNWARGNPSFVVVMLELVAWLSKRSGENLPIQVGDPVVLDVDMTVFEPKIKLQAPSPEGEAEGPALTLDAVQGEGEIARTIPQPTAISGFYEATLKEHSGKETLRSIAVNVDAREGDTRLAELNDVTNVLRPAGIALESAAGFSAPLDFSGERPWSDLFLYAVLVFLVAETFLAGRILPPIRGKSN